MKVLILYPHWHPANLAGVHRPRLIGNYLPGLGWQPVVLTVEAKHFEEAPDPDFARTFAPHYEVHRVKALPVTHPRIIGDIGLRAFFQLRQKAIQLIRKNQFDFLWAPVPSFYMANLARLVHEKTRIPYGIDYIDPWVRDISNRNNLRARLSQWAARKLEPHAVAKASLISGVARSYYAPMLERNFAQKQTQPVTVEMPYGFDPNDHEISLPHLQYPWENNENAYLYAGAFLPNSGYFTQLLFRAMSKIDRMEETSPHTQLYFIGTGNYIHKSITQYAREEGIDHRITEIRKRFPFLHVLNYLSAAQGVMVIGSTEKHYTASKIYQALLSKRPVFAIFHAASSAAQVMQECHADQYLVRYHESLSENALLTEISNKLHAFLSGKTSWQPRLTALDAYAARQSARVLADGMNKALGY